jgi:hypothetical protein
MWIKTIDSKVLVCGVSSSPSDLARRDWLSVRGGVWLNVLRQTIYVECNVGLKIYGILRRAVGVQVHNFDEVSLSLIRAFHRRTTHTAPSVNCFTRVVCTKPQS